MRRILILLVCLLVFTGCGKLGVGWERVSSASFGDRTDRMRVDGGYIYRETGSSGGVSIVFVPDPPKGP